MRSAGVGAWGGRARQGCEENGVQALVQGHVGGVADEICRGGGGLQGKAGYQWAREWE